MDMEQEIKAAGADKGPRITLADIEANIASEWYFTAAQGCHGAMLAGVPTELQPPIPTVHPLHLLTFCVLVLKNGTKIVGINYGAISPELHSAAIGKSEARKNAIDQVWPLLGFQLRTDLHGRAYSASGQSAPGALAA